MIDELTDIEVKLLKALKKHKYLMFFERLIRNGYVEKWPSGYGITEKGRKALKDNG